MLPRDLRREFEEVACEVACATCMVLRHRVSHLEMTRIELVKRIKVLQEHVHEQEERIASMMFACAMLA